MHMGYVDVSVTFHEDPNHATVAIDNEGHW